MSIVLHLNSEGFALKTWLQECFHEAAHIYNVQDVVSTYTLATLLADYSLIESWLELLWRWSLFL